MPKSIEIFFCYAREDELLRQGLEKQLSLLRRQHVIDVWHDRMISPGTEWGPIIDQHLNTAQIILLLVSPDFMDSDYCYGKEMERAMERHARGDALVIPVILRPIYWQKAPFGKLQALPKDGEPVASRKWYSRDAAFYNVAEGIRNAVVTITEEQRLPIKETIHKNPETQQQAVLRVSQTSNEADYTTITEALVFARDGTRIEVQPGTYYEKLIITQNVELVAVSSDDAVIIVSPAPCLRITAQQARIVGLKFRAQQKIVLNMLGGHAAVEIESGFSTLHDCNITNTTGAGVSIWGKKTAPTLSKCYVHDCEAQGILFSDRATGTLEACHIYANKAQGVEIVKRANPYLINCRIYQGQERGMIVWQEGMGILEECFIADNRGAGLEIRDKGNPTLRECDIRQNEQNGIVIVAQGQGTLQDCYIEANNWDNIMIQGNSAPSIRGSRVAGGKRNGIIIQEPVAARIEGCYIQGNAYAGIVVLQHGNSIIYKCRIVENGSVGVVVGQGGSVTLEECTIERNTNYEVRVTEKSAIHIRRGSILHEKKRDQTDEKNSLLSTIWISDGSMGTIEHCSICTKDPYVYAVWVHKDAELQLRTCDIESLQYSVMVSEKSEVKIYSSTSNASEKAKAYVCEQGSKLFINGKNISSSTQLAVASPQAQSGSSTPTRDDISQLINSSEKVKASPYEQESTLFINGKNVSSSTSLDVTSAQTQSGPNTSTRDDTTQLIHKSNFSDELMNTHTLHFIWIISVSNSMAGDKIQALNTVIRELIPEMRNAVYSTSSATVKVRAITFSNNARWHIAQPTSLDELSWQDVAVEGSRRDIGQAVMKVTQQLRVSEIGEHALRPILVLATDGPPTDDFEHSLAMLMAQPWGRIAVRLAIGIGDNAPYKLLQKFIGNPEIQPSQPNDIGHIIKYQMSVSDIQAVSEAASEDVW